MKKQEKKQEKVLKNICPFCKEKIEANSPTGKFLTKIKIIYPNEVVGSRIVKEIKCCIKCSGEEYLEETETSKELIEVRKNG